MSEAPVPAQGSALSPAAFPARPPYRLTDDLSRLCLPQEFKDSHRVLAWANSICALFLAVGLVGLNPPKTHVRPVGQRQDLVPVTFNIPVETPRRQPQPIQAAEPSMPQDAPAELPQVAPVVAAVRSADIPLPVPVRVASAIAPAARLATPPPPRPEATPEPAVFQPGPNAVEGVFPPPSYPAVALRNRYEGTVIIEIRVDTAGVITEAKVQKTSGYPVLDDAALQAVRTRWWFPPGRERWLIWPCRFELR